MTDVYAAGAAAAFTIDILVYPLDTIKTRYQSQDYIKHDAANPLKPLALRGLYQGIGSVVLATVPAAGLFFSTYEGAKTVFSQALPSLPTPLIHSAASATAEMASCLVLAPAEVIKQNAQMISASGTKSSSSTSTSMQAFRMLGGGQGSARRLFTGYTALVARNLPFTALQFPMYEHLRSKLWESRRGDGDGDGGQREQRLLETGLISGASAGSAGAVAAYITTPSDVVKTRMMLSAGQQPQGEGGKARPRLGARAVARLVYEERGIRGFFRGGLFRAGWTALGSGLYLGTYDVAKLWLTRRREDNDGALVL